MDLSSIGIAVGIGSKVIGGILGYNSAKAQANAAEYASLINSRNYLESGIRNAYAITAATAANNKLTAAMSILKSNNDWQAVEYNANLKMIVGDYKAQLLEAEATHLAESANLDIEQLRQNQARATGKILTAYGASGAEINATDSVATAIIDSETQYELDKLVVRHGADIQIAKVRDEAAMSRWDGLMSAQQIIYNGAKDSMNTLISGASSIIGQTMQGTIDSNMAYQNAWIGAVNIANGGVADSSNMSVRATSAFANGLFSAGSTAISAYIDNISPNETLASTTQMSGDVPTWDISTEQSRATTGSYNFNSKSSYDNYLSSLLQ